MCVYSYTYSSGQLATFTDPTDTRSGRDLEETQSRLLEVRRLAPQVPPGVQMATWAPLSGSAWLSR
mgnify:CR=1 FL=1